MTKTILAISSLALFFAADSSYGMGGKKMQISELKGVTETQVALNEGKANVLVRGKAAELLFKVMKEKQEEQADTAALKWIGSKDGMEWKVRGRQITCSKIKKKKVEDYACAFELDQKGSVAAASEAFDVNTFNLTRTATASKLFKNSKSRSLASASANTSFNKGLAYLVYDEPGKQRASKEAMIVFRGNTAKDILGLLKNGKSNGEAHWGEAQGRKGDDIACVEALGKEPARCALVVSFKDGSTTHRGNPLYR
jgi:hypothetical protein